MEKKSFTRYRIRTRPFLCLSIEEVLETDITSAEETIEELTLIPATGLGIFTMFAAIINKPNEEIKNIPVIRRGELVFEKRSEAVNYIKRQGKDVFILCGVNKSNIISKEEIAELTVGNESNGLIDKQLKGLREFDTRNKT
ncbi:MAG TPA: hypothetical protein P5025_09435 [Candidatus Ratteibacteria bacterium]|nr:hypothetical protein [Candidatus Ratteibacteria bacterium]